jgi:hypothetical protein
VPGRESITRRLKLIVCEGVAPLRQNNCPAVKRQTMLRHTHASAVAPCLPLEPDSVTSGGLELRQTTAEEKQKSQGGPVTVYCLSFPLAERQNSAERQRGARAGARARTTDSTARQVAAPCVRSMASASLCIRSMQRVMERATDPEAET